MNQLRRERIGKYIQEKGAVTVKEVSALFPDVSLMTIHRDLEKLEEEIDRLLGEIHNSLYQKALENRERRTYTAASMEEILSIAGDPEKTGFIRTMWCEDPACEARMKEEAGLTSRCMPLEQEHLYDVCPICGKPAKSMIIWGKAY